MPLTDYASIILSQTNPRQAAIRSWASYRRQRREKQDAEINGFINAIGDVPNLIKQKQEEDDVKSVSDTFLGSLAQDGDLEGGMQAVKMLRPRTAAGSAAAMKLAIQMDTLRRNRMADKAEQERLKIAKENAAYASGERMRESAASDDLARLLHPYPDQEAMMGMSSVPVDDIPMTYPSATDPGLVEAWLGGGHARIGDPGVSNLLSVREQKSRADADREARAAAAADHVSKSKEAEANKVARARVVESLAKSLDVPYSPDMTSDDVLQWAKYRDEKNKPEKPAPEDPATKAARIRQAQIDIDRKNHVGPDFRPQEGGQVTEAGRIEFQRRKELADFDVKRAEREVAKWEKILNSEKDKALWSAANKLEEDAADTTLRQNLAAAEKSLDDALSAQRKTLEVPVTGGGNAADPFLDSMPPGAKEDFLKLSPAEQAKVRKAMGSK